MKSKILWLKFHSILLKSYKNLNNSSIPQRGKMLHSKTFSGKMERDSSQWNEQEKSVKDPRLHESIKNLNEQAIKK